MTEGTVEFQSKICLFLLLSGCLPRVCPTCVLRPPRRPGEGIRFIVGVFAPVCALHACSGLLEGQERASGLLSECLPPCVPHMRAWGSRRPGEGIRSPGARVTDSSELPCGFWELNSGPLQEQPVLVTLSPLSRTKHLILTSRKIEDRE